MTLQGYRIETLYAVIATASDGSEGIPAVTLPGLGTTPMVFSDPTKLDRFRVSLKDLAKRGDVTMNVRTFTLVSEAPL